MQEQCSVCSTSSSRCTLAGRYRRFCSGARKTRQYPHLRLSHHCLFSRDGHVRGKGQGLSLSSSSSIASATKNTDTHSCRFTMRSIGGGGDKNDDLDWTEEINEFIQCNIDTSARKGWKISPQARMHSYSNSNAADSSRTRSEEVVVTAEDRHSGALIGVIIFILIRTIELQVVEVVVHQNKRRKGIAMSLLQIVMAVARGDLERINGDKDIDIREWTQDAGGNSHSSSSTILPLDIFLEVSDQNSAARMLYHKAGFKEIGRRDNYYSNGDACVLMSS